MHVSIFSAPPQHIQCRSHSGVFSPELAAEIQKFLGNNNTDPNRHARADAVSLEPGWMIYLYPADPKAVGGEVLFQRKDGNIFHGTTNDTMDRSLLDENRTITLIEPLSGDPNDMDLSVINGLGTEYHHFETDDRTILRDVVKECYGEVKDTDPKP